MENGNAKLQYDKYNAKNNGKNSAIRQEKLALRFATEEFAIKNGWVQCSIS